MLFTAGVYICFAAAFVLANPSFNKAAHHSSSEDDASFADFMLFLGCVIIPAGMWYVLFRGCYLYRCFRGRRRDLVGDYNQARREEILHEGPSATGIEIV
jgi:hypothetical protein